MPPCLLPWPSASTALSIALVAGMPVAAGAQAATTPDHQSTAAAAGARFEMLQSSIDAKWTFRLDRFAGRVWLLVKTDKNDAIQWEETPVTELPKVTAPGLPRFQLFSSGIAARHTFLLDGDTGKTWIAVIGPRKRPDGSAFDGPLWQPIAD